MKIYVVTDGEYSDYHIITATTDQSVAEKIAKKFGADIEEYENAEIMLQPLWFIRFDKNGDVCECHQDTSGFFYDCIGLCRFDVEGQVYTHIAADTAERAIKAGAERRAKFLAEKLML
jgi:hypothetical protein